jgi:MYXO-CTERM domain-containing protein
LAPIVAAAAVLGVPTPANAINGARERVEPQFEDVACMTRVVRSVDPVFHIAYSVERDDVELDPEDVPSGRRHQFLALAKQSPHALPDWISWADVSEAATADLVDAGEVADGAVFESASAWPDGTWVRITPDSPRLPITLEQAAAGVDWDTSTVGAGPWQVLGYTWDPERNEHQLRDGLVMIVDGDGDSPAPGVHLTVPGDPIFEGETLSMNGCADAMPGSTFAVHVAEVIPDVEPEWRLIEASIEGAGTTGRGSLDLEWEVPFDLGGSPAAQYRVRLTIEDPQGRIYEAHPLRRLEILDAGDPVIPESGCQCAAPARGSGQSGFPLVLLAIGTAGAVRRRSPNCKHRMP